MSIRKELRRLANVVEGVAQTFGPYCEVVLHDLTHPDHSIVAISNGHVTGRRVGDAVPDAHLYELANRFPDRDVIVGYRSHTLDGRPLRCTTIFFRDDHGRPYAALGINYELSLVQALNAQTAHLLDDSSLRKPGPIAGGVKNLMKQLIAEAVRTTGKALAQLNRDDRVAIARHLEEHGAFVIRGSVASVARELGVSRVAMYTYIEEARQQMASSEPRQAAGPKRPKEVSVKTNDLGKALGNLPPLSAQG